MKKYKPGPSPSQTHLDAISGYLLDGLTLDEACILTGYPVADMRYWKVEKPSIVDLFDKKVIEFKHKHLRQMTISPSEKNSQWLLEKLRPSEFGPPKMAIQPPAINLVAQFVKNIQENYGLANFVQSGVPGEKLGLTSKSLDTPVTPIDILNG